MISNPETLDIIRTGDVHRILQHLHTITLGEFRTAFIADLVAMTKLIAEDEYKLYDSEINILPWWEEQEHREKMISTYSGSDAWEEWPVEHLEFLFSKSIIGFRNPVDLDLLMDIAYLLPNLEFLSLSRQLPRDGVLIVRNMCNLKGIECSQSGVKEVSDEILTLHGLKSLSLVSNEIRTIPDAWSQMSLDSLDLSSNALEVVPSWIFSMPNLKELRLGGNRLTEIRIPQERLNLEWKRLCLMDNPIRDLCFLSQFKSIDSLTLERTQSSVYPSMFPIVKSIGLDSDQWPLIAPRMQEGLVSIHITNGNTRVELSALREPASGVVHLALRQVRVGFGSELKRFTRLRNLSVFTGTDFNGLPSGLFELQNLESLSFENCNIGNLNGPWSILRNLTWVIFFSCEISEIPYEFFSLPQDVTLDLRNNKISTVQQAMLKLQFDNLQI